MSADPYRVVARRFIPAPGPRWGVTPFVKWQVRALNTGEHDWRVFVIVVLTLARATARWTKWDAYPLVAPRLRTLRASGIRAKSIGDAIALRMSEAHDRACARHLRSEEVLDCFDDSPVFPGPREVARGHMKPLSERGKKGRP